MTSRRAVSRIGLSLTACLVLATQLAVSASAQPLPPLAQLEFDIVGIRLAVDPAALTVPKDIATQINTHLMFSTAGGVDTTNAVASLTADTIVEGELRGPGIPPVRLTVKPGQPLAIPALALPGDYFLDQIRLVKNGQTILNATPSVVPIKVISEVLVSSVSSRPLSLSEIQEKGIVIDQNNFQAVNFQLAFNIAGTPFTINLPVAQPTTQLLQFQPNRDQVVKTLATINKALATQAVKLPPEFDRPGLNFSVAALPFVPVDPADDEALSFGPPPINALLVIPGNIAFLNQFFSALLVVSNVAPGGTPLVLRDVQAKITLPVGLDGVAGTFEQPGDDPLRLARVQGAGQQPVIPVVQRGPDGKLGTADDTPVIPAQKQGEGEFLVEGLREGSSTVDIDITAVLDGLPSGPVKLMGKATGAVFVRNPTFSITLSHPRTIRSGEPYDLYATITNTSQTTANLVSVNLDSRSASGAQLISPETVQFDTLPAGQSATAKFSLVAHDTGDITFSSFTSDPGVTGRFQLRTGIGERGAPLAANAIVLPKTADALPASLVAAAQRVLGQAFSIATTPAEALPPDVLFVKRQTVIDRGLELAEVGQRVQFGEPLSRVIQDLLLDWLGAGVGDDGFDQLMRTTDAGRSFLAEVGKIMNTSVAASTVLDYQARFAGLAVSRGPHLSALTGAGGGGAPVVLRVIDDAGRAMGQAAGGSENSLPFSGLVNLQSASPRADLAVVARVNSTQYTVEVTGTGAGSFDLGIVAPTGARGLTQLSYIGVPIDAGGIARVVINLADLGAPILEVRSEEHTS